MYSKKREEKKKQLVREGRSESEITSILNSMTFTDFSSYSAPSVDTSTSIDSGSCGFDGGSFGGCDGGSF